MNPRYDAQRLLEFSQKLLTKAGLAGDRARTMAEILLEGDLLGHTTHGLQLLSPYLKSIQAGTMALSGEPRVINDRGGHLTWDGNYLPGPWLVVKAIEEAENRVAEHGVVTVNIRRAHHIACLQAYLKPVTDRGLLILLTCSDPSVASVAPFGGIEPLYTPNPFAAGIPTEEDPILMDISMSTTTNGLTMRLKKKGERLPYPWLKDCEGNPTDDPGVMFTDPPGTIQPLGGMDSGHKGFALGLLVEALTSALGGQGRAASPNRWGASVFLQIIDPEFFGGRQAFLHETKWMADACRRNRVCDGDPPVRLPGESGLKKRRDQLENGVWLHPAVMSSLTEKANDLGVSLPEPLPQ